jgi:hypothetical protein
LHLRSPRDWRAAGTRSSQYFITFWLWCVEAEAFDGCEDIVRRFGPLEWFGIDIVPADEGGDIGAKCVDALIDAAPDLFVGQQGEEALDLIEP